MDKPTVVILQAQDGEVEEVLYVYNYDKNFIPTLKWAEQTWNAGSDEYSEVVHAQLRNAGYRLEMVENSAIIVTGL